MKKFFSFKVVLLVSFVLFLSYGKGLNDSLKDILEKDDGKRIQSIFSTDTIKPTGGYGSSYVKGLFLSEGAGVLVGGKGAFIFNDSFAFGGFGAGFVSDVKKDDYKIGMGFGGIYTEGIFNLSSPIHLAAATYLGFGGFSGKKNDDKEDEDKISKFGVVFTPELSIELNITHFFIIAIGGGYQFVFADFNKVLDQKDFSGATLNLSFKWGKF